jgi:hypothetical protein
MPALFMSLFPHPLPLGTPVDVFAGALGGTAAVLLIGGSIFLRGQRNRHQFTLMQAALEKGITAFPGQPPFWLLSLRQGITTIALGVALVIVGSGAWAIGHSVQRPDAAIASEPKPPPPQFQGPGGPDGPPELRGGPGPEGREGPGLFGGPEGRRPPQRNPLIEQWQRAQMEETVGQIALGCGIVLLLLGCTRTAFAKTERRFGDAPTTPA